MEKNQRSVDKTAETQVGKDIDNSKKNDYNTLNKATGKDS